MKKVTLLLIMVTLFSVGVTLGLTEIEISKDNETWFSIESGGKGYIDENNSFAWAEMLQPTTQYYYRAKNETTSWTYGSFVTKGDTMLSIIIGLAVIGAFFGLVGYMSQGFTIRVLFWGLTLVQVVTMTFMLYLNEVGEPISDLLYTNFQIIFLVSFGVAMIVLFVSAFKILMPSKEDGLDKETKWMGGGDKWQEK